MGEFFKVLKDYQALIIFAVSFYSIRGLFTFMSAKPLERQLYSKENKLLFDLINLSALFIFLPTILFITNINQISFIINFIEEYIYLFAFIYILLSFLFMLSNFYYNFYKKLIFNHTNKLYKLSIKYKLREILLLIYIFVTFFVNGFLNTFAFSINTTFKTKIVLLLLLVLFEIIMIFSTLYLRSNNTFKSKMLVEIKMDNGDIYSKYYIYNPTINNFLLIGKASNPNMCNDPILIPINKITSCQQVQTLRKE